MLVGARCSTRVSGQTKDNSIATRWKLVVSLVRDPLEIWLNAHVDHAAKSLN